MTIFTSLFDKDYLQSGLLSGKFSGHFHESFQASPFHRGEKILLQFLTLNVIRSNSVRKDELERQHLPFISFSFNKESKRTYFSQENKKNSFQININFIPIERSPLKNMWTNVFIPRKGIQSTSIHAWNVYHLNSVRKPYKKWTRTLCTMRCMFYVTYSDRKIIEKIMSSREYAWVSTSGRSEYGWCRFFGDTMYLSVTSTLFIIFDEPTRKMWFMANKVTTVQIRRFEINAHF